MNPVLKFPLTLQASVPLSINITISLFKWYETKMDKYVILMYILSRKKQFQYENTLKIPSHVHIIKTLRMLKIIYLFLVKKIFLN